MVVVEKFVEGAGEGAVRRGAAHGSGGRDAFSASRSEGPDWPAERATRREGDPSEGRPVGRAKYVST